MGKIKLVLLAIGVLTIGAVLYFGVQEIMLLTSSASSPVPG